jgi:hypothetical protein
MLDRARVAHLRGGDGVNRAGKLRSSDHIYASDGRDRFTSAAFINTDPRPAPSVAVPRTAPPSDVPRGTLTEAQMRKAARIDRNQPEIVDALRAAGCAVAITSNAGDGFPDLVVARRARGDWRPTVYLIEVKDGQRPPSERLLTPDQKRFHGEFAGCCYIAYSVTDALAIVGLGPR